jgi:CRP-like cAMP-binding protein
LYWVHARAGELLIMRHTEEVRLVTAPAIVGESVLLNLLPDGPHVRPVTLRAISPCMLWALTIRDLEHIFNVSLPLAIAPPSDLLSSLESIGDAQPCACRPWQPQSRGDTCGDTSAAGSHMPLYASLSGICDATAGRHNMLNVCSVRLHFALLQILPELRHKLIDMFERRMKLNLRHASEHEREHWCEFLLPLMRNWSL